MDRIRGGKKYSIQRSWLWTPSASGINYVITRCLNIKLGAFPGHTEVPESCSWIAALLTGTFWESPGRFVCEQMQQEQNGHRDVSGPEGLGRRGGAPCSCCQGWLGPPVRTRAGTGSGGELGRIFDVPYMRWGSQRRGWQSGSWSLTPVSVPEENTAWPQRLLPDWSPGCRQTDLGPSQLLSRPPRSHWAPGFPHTAAERWSSEPGRQKTTNLWGPHHLQGLNCSPSLELLKRQKRKVVIILC